jgi:hypothetical protein
MVADMSDLIDRLADTLPELRSTEPQSLKRLLKVDDALHQIINDEIAKDAMRYVLKVTLPDSYTPEQIESALERYHDAWKQFKRPEELKGKTPTR